MTNFKAYIFINIIKYLEILYIWLFDIPAHILDDDIRSQLVPPTTTGLRKRERQANSKGVKLALHYGPYEDMC